MRGGGKDKRHRREGGVLATHCVTSFSNNEI